MTTPTYIVPFEGFSYHPHQTEAIEWMIGREVPSALYFRGGIEADEMGLGKTYITIGLLLNNPVPNTLILVPPALQHQWAKCLLDSSIPHTVLLPGKMEIVGGSRDFAVTLGTYDRAINNIHKLQDTTYDRLICDEGHIFKNGKNTKRFRVLSELVAPRRWILTGTPIHNSKKDFINLLMFLGNKVPLGKDTLVKPASIVMLRRIVDDVKEAVPTMPAHPPTHIVHPITMPEGSEEATIFGALVRRLEAAIEAQRAQWIILELYLRIRQFIAHPAIYIDAMNRKYKGSYTRPKWLGTASKMTEFQSYMATSERTPSIVFTTFVDEMDRADRILQSLGYKTWQIRGGMTEAGRIAAIEESKAAVEAEEPVVILVQIVAGGCGLNLQHCSRIIMLTSHWNPAIVDQAIARAYRMGQIVQVEVHHFVLADDAELNIDRKIAGAHGRKRLEALEVHHKLHTESAIEYETMMDILDRCLELDGADEGEDPTPVSTTATTAAITT